MSSVKYTDNTGFYVSNPSVSNTYTYCYVKPEILTPTVKDVEVIGNKVVICKFTDGTKEKAVCDEADRFSLERGISICIAKKVMGGSSNYNKTINKALKGYHSKLKKAIKDKEEQVRISDKKKKCAEKKAKYIARKNEAEKERQIEIQKEAYIRAMKYINNKEI